MKKTWHGNLHEITMAVLSVEFQDYASSGSERMEEKLPFASLMWYYTCKHTFNASLYKFVRAATKVPHIEWFKEQKCII